MSYDVRTEPHFPIANGAIAERATRETLKPPLDQSRAKIENILWFHQLTWDDRIGGKKGHQALCAECKWRSGLKEHRWEAALAHSGHVADLIVDGVVFDDVVNTAAECAADALTDLLEAGNALGIYFELLVEKARQTPGVDPAILDRIESVIAARARIEQS